MLCTISHCHSLPILRAWYLGDCQRHPRSKLLYKSRLHHPGRSWEFSAGTMSWALLRDSETVEFSAAQSIVSGAVMSLKQLLKRTHESTYHTRNEGRSVRTFPVPLGWVTSLKIDVVQSVSCNSIFLLPICLAWFSTPLQECVVWRGLLQLALREQHQ